MAACHASSLCCQGIVFVTLVIKLWVNNFAAQSTVVEVLSCDLAALSSGMVLQKKKKGLIFTEVMKKTMLF